MITAAELTAMRTDAGRILTTTVVITRKTQTPDTSGGFTDTWATVNTVKGYFNRYRLSPLERETGIRIQLISYWEFFLPAGTDVRPTDRLLADGRTFEVVGGAGTSYDVLLQVVTQEIV